MKVPLRYCSGEIPKWCGLSPSAHNDGLGGCWGISYGFVRKEGEAYCANCEYRLPLGEQSEPPSEAMAVKPEGFRATGGREHE